LLVDTAQKALRSRCALAEMSNERSREEGTKILRYVLEEKR
jgi:hypothetical protein